MEHKIGDRITLEDGRVVEVMEGETCERCIFHKTRVNCFAERKYVLGNCIAKYRTDHKNIIYKEIKEE